MAENWTALLDKYINKLISPDGRQTYESKDELVNLMLKLAELKKSDKVMDIGCGWGNFSKVCSNFSDEDTVKNIYKTQMKMYVDAVKNIFKKEARAKTIVFEASFLYLSIKIPLALTNLAVAVN